MREILFKGFCQHSNGKDTIMIDGKIVRGDWIVGWYGKFILSCGWNLADAIVSKEDAENGKWEAQRVIPETVCEFTGLEDKNGKQIFEGNVVECCSWNEFFSKNNEPLKPFQRKFVVAHHNGCMRLREDYDGVIEPNYWDIIFNGDCKVIGTIFDVKEDAND